MKNKNLVLEDGGVELAIRNSGGRQAGSKNRFLAEPWCRLGSWARQTSRQTNKLTKQTPNSNSQTQALAFLPLWSILFKSSPYCNVGSIYVILVVLHIDFFCPLWLRSMAHSWCSTLPGRIKSSNAQEDSGLSSA